MATTELLLNSRKYNSSPNHYIHADGTKVVKPIDESTTNVILSRNRLQLTPVNSIILRREQKIADTRQTKQDKLNIIQRALQDEIAFQRIDADERAAHREFYYPDEIPLTTVPITTMTPPLVDDTSREQREHHHQQQQRARLSHYLASFADLEPRLAFPVITHSETNSNNTYESITNTNNNNNSNNESITNTNNNNSDNNNNNSNNNNEHINKKNHHVNTENNNNVDLLICRY